MREIWKDIPGYEGYYQVSNMGQVKSLSRLVPHLGHEYLRKGRIRKLQENQGYLCVTLNKNSVSKSFGVHQLVALAFIPNPGDRPFVNHIDGNKRNNCLDNLEWVTAQENILHAIATGLVDVEQCKINGRKSIDAVATRVLCEDTGEVFESQAEVCRQLGNECIIYNIHQHKRSHNGRGWLFRIIDEEYYQAHKDDIIDQNTCKSIHDMIKKRIKHQGKAQPVYCVERNIQYPSRIAAARDNNMDAATIELAIKENRKAKGLTFRYIEDTNID